MAMVPAGDQPQDPGRGVRIGDGLRAAVPGDPDPPARPSLLGDILADIADLRANIHVTDAKGTRKLAREWVGKGGRMRRIKGARITRDETLLGAFVAVQDKGMKDAWCLVVSRADWSGSEVKKRYGKRFTCEETSGTSKTCGSAWE